MKAILLAAALLIVAGAAYADCRPLPAFVTQMQDEGALVDILDRPNGERVRLWANLWVEDDEQFPSGGTIVLAWWRWGAIAYLVWFDGEGCRRQSISGPTEIIVAAVKGRAA